MNTATQILSNYITACADGQTILPTESISYHKESSSFGTNISHLSGSTDFILAGGQTYYIEFGVNGFAATTRQGMIFAVKVNAFATEGRATSQNINEVLPYNSAWGSYFVTVPAGRSSTVSIQNLGIDTITSTNSCITIIQITNN